MIGASARSDEHLPEVPERTVLIRQAFRLEWLTVAWMVIEALVAIGSGVIAGSLTLTAFGLDSVIELISAVKYGLFGSHRSRYRMRSPVGALGGCAKRPDNAIAFAL
jgi:hypothetical protein